MSETFTAVPVPDRVPKELGLSAPEVKWGLMENSGDSGDSVYRVTADGQPNRWVKTSTRLEWMELAAQRDRLEWLAGKLPVPKLLGYAKTGDREWLVTTEIAGLCACDDDLALPRPEKVKLLARGLKQIHSIDPTDCPFCLPLSEKFARVESFVPQADHAVRARFALLKKLPRPPEDPVFCHGDYCEPNIIIQGDKISGYIDLGFAGVMDRYAEFAQACYSLVRNGDGEYLDLFFAEYGLPDVSYAKILYYHELEFCLGA